MQSVRCCLVYNYYYDTYLYLCINTAENTCACLAIFFLVFTYYNVFISSNGVDVYTCKVHNLYRCLLRTHHLIACKYITMQREFRRMCVVCMCVLRVVHAVKVWTRDG